MKSNGAKLFVVMMILVIFFPIIARAAGETVPFSNIVFFGDSLSDNGNLYSFDLGFLPKSPPYFQGRFSNKEVWSDRVAKTFYDQSHVNSVNYAVGGQTAVFHNPINGFLPYSLTASLDSYLLYTVFSDRAKTLFVIWIGSNDYLPQKVPAEDPDDPSRSARSKLINQLTDDVVSSIRATIESLIYHGGANFLIINMPDMSMSPYARDSGKTELLHDFTTTHNAKLEAAITEIQNSYKEVNVHLFDVNEIFLTVFFNLDAFNRKYNIHLTNIDTACWQGGYTLAQREEQINEDEIARRLEQHIKMQTRSHKNNRVMEGGSKLDVDAFAHFIAMSPALSETYKVEMSAMQGVLACENPDEYVFWDHIHPTAIMHEVLSAEVTDYIKRYYSVG